MNTQEALLRRSLHPAIDYELVSSAQLGHFLQALRFLARLLQAIYGFSGTAEILGVGFSADGAQAFFYFSNRCEGLCVGRATTWLWKNATVAGSFSKDIGMWVS